MVVFEGVYNVLLKKGHLWSLYALDLLFGFEGSPSSIQLVIKSITPFYRQSEKLHKSLRHINAELRSIDKRSIRKNGLPPEYPYTELLVLKFKEPKSMDSLFNLTLSFLTFLFNYTYNFVLLLYYKSRGKTAIDAVTGKKVSFLERSLSSSSLKAESAKQKKALTVPTIQLTPATPVYTPVKNSSEGRSRSKSVGSDTEKKPRLRRGSIKEYLMKKDIVMSRSNSTKSNHSGLGLTTNVSTIEERSLDEPEVGSKSVNDISLLKDDKRKSISRYDLVSKKPTKDTTSKEVRRLSREAARLNKDMPSKEPYKRCSIGAGACSADSIDMKEGVGSPVSLDSNQKEPLGTLSTLLADPFSAILNYDKIPSRDRLVLPERRRSFGVFRRSFGRDRNSTGIDTSLASTEDVLPANISEMQNSRPVNPFEDTLKKLVGEDVSMDSIVASTPKRNHSRQQSSGSVGVKFVHSFTPNLKKIENEGEDLPANYGDAHGVSTDLSEIEYQRKPIRAVEGESKRDSLKDRLKRLSLKRLST